MLLLLLLFGVITDVWYQLCVRCAEKVENISYTYQVYSPIYWIVLLSLWRASLLPVVLFTLIFISHVHGVESPNRSLVWKSYNVSPLFLSIHFRFNALICRSWMHFDLTWVNSVKGWCSFTLLMWLSNFPSNICWKELLYPTEWFWLVYHILLGGCMCAGSFLWMLMCVPLKGTLAIKMGKFTV